MMKLVSKQKCSSRLICLMICHAIFLSHRHQQAYLVSGFLQHHTQHHQSPAPVTLPPFSDVSSICPFSPQGTTSLLLLSSSSSYNRSKKTNAVRGSSSSRVRLHLAGEDGDEGRSLTTTKTKAKKKKKTEGKTKVDIVSNGETTVPSSTTAEAGQTKNSSNTAKRWKKIGSVAKGIDPTSQQNRRPPPQQRQQYPNPNRKGGPRGKFQNNNNNNSNRKNLNNNPNTNKKKKGYVWSPPENRKLNQEIVSCENAQQVLQLAATQKGALATVGGGGKFNSVNFSTVLHRLGKHLQYNNFNDRDNHKNNAGKPNYTQIAQANRAKILADPRFALLLCCTAEAFAAASSPDKEPIRDITNSAIRFSSREMSNIAWAMAKFNIVPPQRVLPIDMDGAADHLDELASTVRNQVYQVAKERRSGQPPQQPSTVWMADVSKLCGYLLDLIQSKSMKVDPNQFQIQEWSNMIWALATVQRGSETTIAFIVNSLITGMGIELGDSQDNPEAALRPQEWSNSVWALATSGVLGPEQKLLPFVADLMEEYPPHAFLEKFKPQELSNTAWGVATILSKSDQKELLQGPAANASLRILRQVAKQLIQRQGVGYKSQELTNTIWAFATLGFGLPSSTSSAVLNDNKGTDYTFLKSDDEEGDKQLMQTAVNVVIATAKNHERQLGFFRSQEINNVAWTLCRLEYPFDGGGNDQSNIGGDEFLKMIGQEMGNTRRPVTSQDIGTTIWSLASMGFFDEEVYRGLAYRLTPDDAVKAKPQELSNLVWAIATADIKPKFVDVFDLTLLHSSKRPSVQQAQSDPITRAFGLAGQELMRRPHEFKTQEIKDTLWAFSRAGIRHPKLFQSVAEHLVGSGDSKDFNGRGLDEFSPQGLGNLAWAYARQAQLGSETMQKREGQTLVAFTSGRLAHYNTIFIDVGESLLQKLFFGIAEANLRVHDNLSRLKPQDLSNTAWAFAILGMKHTQFLDAVIDQLVQRTGAFVKGKRDSYSHFKGQEIANALWGLATLDYIPTDTKLLTKIEPYLVVLATGTRQGDFSLKTIARNLKRQEMANLAWICAVFGEYPPDLIRIVYQGLIGYEENPDPVFVANTYDDEGIDKSAVMSLLYLQIVMDLDMGGSNRFFLPDAFPDEWDTRKGGDNSMIMSDDNGLFDLRLTSSKIQTSVSDAFHRIGFDHVEEYVIGMNELANDYGVQMASIPQEVLSLDIANVESKIAIEVDGPAHFISTIDHGNTATGYVLSIKGKLEYQYKWEGTKQEINGPTALKTRMLNQLGWRVINVPFWEWYSMNGNVQKQEEYCRSKLESVDYGT